MILLAWIVLIPLTFAAQLKPTKPANDLFYDIPHNVSSYENGDIIRRRDAPGLIRSFYYPLDVNHAWQFLVKSEDSHGNDTAFVTTLLEPYDADPDRLLSYQFAEDAASINCGPSYAMLFNADMDTVVTQLEMFILQTALSNGWYVVASDYEGPNGAFTAGVRLGKAVLDLIRAVLKTEKETGLKSDTSVALFGYSGGSLASGWAAQLQPSYATEIGDQIVGAALGGWVTELMPTLEAVEGTIFAGLVPLAVHGLYTEYPELKDLIYSQMTDKNREQFDDAGNMCLITGILHFFDLHFYTGPNPMVKDGKKFFDFPEIKNVLTENTLARNESLGVPDFPLFVYHGQEDEIVPFVNLERAYNNYCEWGIELLEFAVSNTTGHILEVLEGTGGAFQWLEDRFDGKPPVQGCLKTYRETNLELPGSVNFYYELVKTAGATFRGGKVGEFAWRNGTAPSSADFVMGLAEALVNIVGPVPLKK